MLKKHIKEFDVICVSETWLIDGSISDKEVELCDYTVFRKDRNRHRVGVAIYVRNSLPVKYLNEYNIDGLELVCIEIRHNTRNFIVACW